MSKDTTKIREFDTQEIKKILEEDPEKVKLILEIEKFNRESELLKVQHQPSNRSSSLY